VKLKGLIKIESKNLTGLTIYMNNTTKGEVTVFEVTPIIALPSLYNLLIIRNLE
jgi:hypothetical protein